MLRIVMLTMLGAGPVPVPRFAPLSYEQSLDLALKTNKLLVVGVQCYPPDGEWYAVRSDNDWDGWGGVRLSFVLVFKPEAGKMRYAATLPPTANEKAVLAAVQTKKAARPPPPPRQAQHRAGDHSHRCPFCEYIWEHSASSRGSTAAHTCPACLKTLPRPWYPYQVFR